MKSVYEQADHSTNKQTQQLKRSITAILGLVITVLLSCQVSMVQGEEKMSLILKSSAFINGGEIPTTFTCEGKDVSPPLMWEGIPEHTRSLVLFVDDPDAPDPRAPKITWVHWVVYNLSPHVAGLAEGASSNNLPPGTKEGHNDWKKIGYGGPCPPIGRHRYFHKLYALDTELKLTGTPSKKMVEAAMKGHIIEKTELIGTYEKFR